MSTGAGRGTGAGTGAVLVRTVVAELVKLRGLPAVSGTVLGTLLAAAVLAAVLAAAATPPVGAGQVVLRAVPLLQVGPVLLGVLAVAPEHTSRQLATTLTATPDRLVLLTAKGLAYLAAAVLTTSLGLALGLLTAWVALASRHTGPADGLGARHLVGAGLYLVLIGLLAFGVTVLLRSLVPPLVTMLSLLLVVSPLLAAVTEHARWLPDRAGSLLYLPADPALTPATGALVLLAWTAGIAAAAAAAFCRRDA